MCKKVEYKQEIDYLVESNLWEITELQRNTDSDPGHVRVYSMQSLQQNQRLNSAVMDVIFYYVAATRSDIVSFSHSLMKQESSEFLLESKT